MDAVLFYFLEHFAPDGFPQSHTPQDTDQQPLISPRTRSFSYLPQQSTGTGTKPSCRQLPKTSTQSKRLKEKGGQRIQHKSQLI